MTSIPSDRPGRPNGQGPDHQLGFEFELPVDATPKGRRAPHYAATTLVRSLIQAQSDDPLARKLVVGRTRGGVRELLRQVARTGLSWSGFEPTTVRPLALEIAGGGLAEAGLRLIDDFDARALVDRAIDEVLSRGSYGRLSDLADGAGLRDRIYGTVIAFRMAGVGPGRLGASNMSDPTRRLALTGILDRYEAGLEQGALADSATVLRMATEMVVGGVWQPAANTRVYLLPELSLSGLTGRFLHALEGTGASRVLTDPVVGLAVPETRLWSAGPPSAAGSWLHDPESRPDYPEPSGDLDIRLFSAAGVAEELKEVLRRVMELGVAWDEVEIITPDPGVYGSALHALCERTSVPVTFGVGLPLARTRPGRAVVQYFRWIEGGFTANDLRMLLEKGDLRPAKRHSGVGAMRLARRFRQLRVGWGRERYARLLDKALAGVAELPRNFWESEEQAEKRRTRAVVELKALRSILAPVLRATPPVPHPRTGGGVPVSAADLATGLQAFLKFVPAEHAVDVTAKDRLLSVLARVAETLDRKTEYAWAAASLHRHLDLRVPAPRAEGKAPWSSDGGSLFLTDIEHGARTGRPVTFIVGMDSSRFPGGGLEDPLLLDGDRRGFGSAVLPTAAERLQDKRFEFAALLARLRGSVTVSYPAWEPAEARAMAPASEVLQTYRLAERNPAHAFRDLHTQLGSAHGVLARTGALDAQDVWMRTLAPTGRPLRGTHLVRQGFPDLDRGLRGVEALDVAKASAWVGKIAARPDLDPRINPERVLSASRLESLGRCPRRYFFGTVLRLRAPDDFVMDPDLWLDALVRGTLLHALYERSLHGAREVGIDYADDAFADLVRSILAEEVARARKVYPAPSQQVADREIRKLEDDAASFVAMVRTHGADWVGLEVRFGLEGEPAVKLPVPDGEITLRGIVDRVDEGGPQGLTVVDYKTGGTSMYTVDRGVFDQGRRLQHVVYAAAVGRLLGRKVARMEYHFPTRKAENRIVAFPEEQLRLGPEILAHLLDGVREGAFLPTDDPRDCTFCDFKHICRVRVGEWASVESPFAEWSRRNRAEVAEFAWILKARNVEEQGPALPGFHARLDGQEP